MLFYFRQKYHEIMASNLSDAERNEQLDMLMTQMRLHYQIPWFYNPEWERKNPEVIRLYRQISYSRK